ncbi:hypothetical protein A0J57_18625 [Sphingobium sp. 22B]|uniref:hypothetical protein n=1 Tax=unclassified Sphingobium TaxID=2611147 RepID=UPI0007836B5C|nr:MULTISPECIES: hypothetical protein [unclassified Sphingobium]KXU29427.1 hypothetical protein AXW74_23060 [Sphingobium sp. AM]KYC30854.1 hypothetical protein A0J57_18625 [Sphingobium sp. 22B]OAP29387.1 hypothetical protein A8O16_23925 [Sphingobium sp. 20006FA]
MAEAIAEQRRGETGGAHHPGPLSVAAMIGLCQPGGIGIAILPALLGALVRSGGFSPAQASMTGSCELAGMTFSLLLSPLLLSRLDRRALAIAAVGVAMAFHLLSLWCLHRDLVFPTMASRFGAGLGEGMISAVGVASLASLARPDRAFGFVVTGNLAGSALVFMAIDRLGLGDRPVGVLVLVLLYSLIFGLSALGIPRRAPALPPRGGDGRGAGNLAPGLLGLAGTLLLVCAMGAVWPLAPQIAAASGIAAGDISGALALSGFVGAGAGLLVGPLGGRLGRMTALALGAAGLSIAMSALTMPLDAQRFYAIATIMMLCWIFSLPFFFGVVASMDLSGRLAALSSATQALGMSVGQLLAAFLLLHATFRTIIYAGSGLALIAILTMFCAVTVGGGRMRRAAA